MSPMSAEATVVRNYLDWLLSLPWGKRNQVVKRDLRKFAEEVLDADHYGLEKVKERILEYLAVQQRVEQAEGPDPVPRRPSRASARPRSASRSPRRRAATSCACVAGRRA
jgi:hypothetical protein